LRTPRSRSAHESRTILRLPAFPRRPTPTLGPFRRSKHGATPYQFPVRGAVVCGDELTSQKAVQSVELCSHAKEWGTGNHEPRCKQVEN
ncbi:unnamed protein product, partial [Urochloa humidicola]